MRLREKRKESAFRFKGRRRTSRDWLNPKSKIQNPKSERVRLIILLLGWLCLVATLAEFIAPYLPGTQHRQSINLPPMRVHFFAEDGRLHLRPFVYQVERVAPRGVGAGRRYAENKQQRYPIRFFVQGDSYQLLGLVASSVHLFGTEKQVASRQSPVASEKQLPATSEGATHATIHLLGTDHLGRDVFSRLVYGSRVTLSIALTSLIVSLLLGLIVGGVSGYFGGRVDAVFMRFGELVQSIPAIFLILALRAAFPLEISFGKTLAMLTGIFAFASWPEVARLVRSNVLSVTARDFVLSAKAVGASDAWIMRRHVLPNTLTPAVLQAAIIVPSFILGEAALSFLGVGVQEPQPSWGNMLAAAQDLTVLLNSWWMLTPGVAIFVTVVAFNALGDAIRDALDPRWRGRSQGWG